MSGIILYMRSAIERRRYIVTGSLIDWAHAQNDPYDSLQMAMFRYILRKKLSVDYEE